MSDDVTIYHNPACGTSRNALAMIEASGYRPIVIEYLTAGWSKDVLQNLIASMGVGAKDIMREKGTPAAELGLTAPGVTDERILDAMVAHPILVNRPIVVTPKGVKLCRPSEAVFDLLEQRPQSFTKEDGEIIYP